MDWQDKKKTKQSSCYWFIFLIDNHQNKKQTKKILFSVPRPMSIQFFCSKTVPDPNLIEGYCKGFNSSKTETLYTLDILTYTSISFYIPFRSVEIDFVDQDDRETHLNIEFIRLMSISFSIPFCSVEIHFEDQDDERETQLNIEFIPVMSISFSFCSIPLYWDSFWRSRWC